MKGLNRWSLPPKSRKTTDSLSHNPFLISRTYRLKRSCIVVSHIQRIGCQLERTILYTVANPARGLLLNREKRGRKRSVAAPRRCSCGGNNKFNFINTHAQRERERERERERLADTQIRRENTNKSYLL